MDEYKYKTLKIGITKVALQIQTKMTHKLTVSLKRKQTHDPCEMQTR